MGYFAFLASWIYGVPLTLGFRYVGVNVIGTSLHGSISGQSPLCHEDCLVDVLLENLTIFGRVVITAASPPISNCFTISSRLVGSNIHLLDTL